MIDRETTSGKKIAKKARQLYKREMQEGAREMGRAIGNVMKPKPAWVPWKLWMWGLSIFIKIKK